VLDGALDGLERPVAGWAGLLDPQRPDRGPAQADQVRPAAEGPTDIGDEHPHVRPPEQVTRASRSRPSNAVTSNASTRIGRAGASSTSPLRAAS
jgi:hypothetical protein